MIWCEDCLNTSRYTTNQLEELSPFVECEAGNFFNVPGNCEEGHAQQSLVPIQHKPP